MLTAQAVVGDAEQYLMAGISRDSTFAQDGTGQWTSPRTGVEYVRTGTYKNYYPTVVDIDQDTRNELIFIDNGYLIIANYTTGLGIATEQTIWQGQNIFTGEQYYITSTAHFWNGSYALVSNNYTHMFVYTWNGTQLVENRSYYWQPNPGAAVTPTNVYADIKCANANQWESGRDTCVIVLDNNNGGSDQYLLVYDLELNSVSASVGVAPPNTDTFPHTTTLFDGDSDGYLEVYHSYMNLPAGDNLIYEWEVNGTSNATSNLLYTHNLAVGDDFTDIIVNRLDGSTPSITWGWTDDDINFYGYTIHADTGGVLENDYCTITSCPEGNFVPGNLWVDDGTFGAYSGDVCYYIRNHGQTDILSGQQPNQDAIMCLSRYAGSDFTTTFVDNPYNFSNQVYQQYHSADLTSTGGGLLTPLFLLDSSGNMQSVRFGPTHQNTFRCIPVDFQENGGLDVICQNQSTLLYYDDAYTNQNYEITGIEWDTGNPVCQYELPTITLTVQDDEMNAGNCYYTETHANGTVMYTSSNATVSEGSFINDETTIDFTYYADTTGTYTLTYYCRDEYHDAYDNRIYNIIVSNTSGCFYKGQGGGETTDETEAEAEADAEFGDSVDSVFGDIGIVSASARAMFWLLVMIAVAFMVFRSYSGVGVVYIIALVEVMMLVLGWVLGLIGAVVLVIVGLICAVLLTMMWLSNKGSG